MDRPFVIIEDAVTIPETALNYEGFRAWTHSNDFPLSGRIDFLAGTIEVDMAPEELQTHGVPKSTLVIWLGAILGDAGQFFIDSTRLTHPAVGLSCEPDIVYVSAETLRSGRVRYAESAKGKLVEIEGAPTLVVEIVSDSSVSKDLKRLPSLYARAGVEELWLVDARKSLRFEILTPYQGGWQPAVRDEEDFQFSPLLQRKLKFEREPWISPRTWRYFVEERARD